MSRAADHAGAAKGKSPGRSLQAPVLMSPGNLAVADGHAGRGRRMAAEDLGGLAISSAA
jgi:hypothetical protein